MDKNRINPIIADRDDMIGRSPSSAKTDGAESNAAPSAAAFGFGFALVWFGFGFGFALVWFWFCFGLLWFRFGFGFALLWVIVNTTH